MASVAHEQKVPDYWALFHTSVTCTSIQASAHVREVLNTYLIDLFSKHILMEAVFANKGSPVRGF